VEEEDEEEEEEAKCFEAAEEGRSRCLRTRVLAKTRRLTFLEEEETSFESTTLPEIATVKINWKEKKEDGRRRRKKEKEQKMMMG
jgi:hypothetical protein